MDNQNNSPQQAGQQPDPQFVQLTNYMQQELERGTESWQLQNSLVAAGWDAGLVAQAFSQLGISIIHPPTPDLPPADMATSSPDLPQYPQAIEAQQQEYDQAQQPQYPATQYPQEQDFQRGGERHDEQLAPQSDAPQKYRVWRAVFDMIGAAKRNAASVTAALAISAVAIIGSVLAATVLAISFVLTQITLVGSTDPLSTLLTLMIAAYVGGFLVTAVVGAISLNTTSLALYAGAEGHKTPVGRTMAHAFRAIPRVIGAMVLTGLVVIGPLLISMLLSFGITAGGRGSGLTGLVVVTSIAGVAWAIVAMLRFALAPYVALFEPEIPIVKTLSRSQHLLIKGGQWFIFKGYLLLLLVTVALVLMSGASSFEEFEQNGSIAGSIGSLLLINIATGVMAMLYRNRRTVRG